MRQRRAITIFVVGTIVLTLLAGAMPRMWEESFGHLGQAQSNTNTSQTVDVSKALEDLEKLEVKGRAPKTGYTRDAFGDGWDSISGCTVRNIILNRDLTDVVLDDECKVVSGTLQDPYSGEVIMFTKERSADVQIDHVIALSDAWQKGAQQLSYEQRVQLANDPLELIAVSGSQNQQKSDGDAATWLPKNRAFRCEYVERQIAVKIKYRLWVTEAEKRAMSEVLRSC